jgi:hypothetical protein
MLTAAQKRAAANLLRERPMTYDNTRVIVDEGQKKAWFDKVYETMKEVGIRTYKDIQKFCDIAGVPD